MRLNRRGLLRLAALSALAIETLQSAVRPASAAGGEQTLSPDEALERLMEGNARFVSGL